MWPITVAFGFALIAAAATNTWQQACKAVAAIWRRIGPRRRSGRPEVLPEQCNLRLTQPPPAPVTCTLPGDIATFTGRGSELDAIATAVTAAARAAQVVAIHAIDGMPGVGKTTLAVRAGHLLTDRFPDAQLFVDMKGHTPGQRPVEPADALALLLIADGVDASRLPGDLDGRSAMWRDRLARRRALLIVDNAASSDQVAPLLPGAPGCAVLITSRRFLGDLPSAVVSVRLDIMPADEAVQMFLSLAPSYSGEPGKVAELVDMCGYLPLAIVLLARLISRHPSWTMDQLISETKAKLLTTCAESRTVAAAFDLSYQYLSIARQRFFRCLSLHPGPDFSPHAAAALTGLPLDEATEHLEGLLRDGLLGESRFRRYQMHDLIRKYAGDLATSCDTTNDRGQAAERVLDYYLYTAIAADRRINPGRDAIALDNARPGVLSQQFTEHEAAWQWFTIERANLLASIEYADRQRLHMHAWQLPWAMATFLDRRGHWQNFLTTHQTALNAAYKTGNQAAQLITHRLLGHICLLLHQRADAIAHLEQAIAVAGELGDPVGLATAHHGLSLACQQHREYARAITHAQQALELYRAAGHRTGEANALSTLGANHFRLNELRQAVAECNQALVLFRVLGDQVGQASTLENLGDIADVNRHPGDAIASYQRAVVLRRQLGDHYLEAVALNRLGDIHHNCGCQGAATRAWQDAWAILDELAHPDAADVRAKLTMSSRRRR